MTITSERVLVLILLICFGVAGCGSPSSGPTVDHPTHSFYPPDPSEQLGINNSDFDGSYHSLSVSYLSSAVHEIYYRTVEHNNGILKNGDTSIFDAENIFLQKYKFDDDNNGQGYIFLRQESASNTYPSTKFIATMNGKFAAFSLGTADLTTPVFHLQIKTHGQEQLDEELFSGSYGFVEVELNGRGRIGEFNFDATDKQAVGYLYSTTDDDWTTVGIEISTAYEIDQNGDLQFLNRAWNMGFSGEIAISGEKSAGVLKDRISILMKNKEIKEFRAGTIYQALQWTIASFYGDGTLSADYNLSENVSWGKMSFQAEKVVVLEHLLGREQYSEAPSLVPNSSALYHFRNNETNESGRFFRFFGSLSGSVLIGLDYGNHQHGRVSLMIALRSV